MRCTSRTRSGNPCKAYAMSGAKTCYLHSSPTAAKQAGSIGARQRNTAARTGIELREFMPPMSALEVRTLLASVIVEVRSHKVDAKVGNSIAVLSSALLRSIAESDIEERLRRIEAVIQQKGQRVWKT